MENEPDVGSQIVVGNDSQQFLASPTFDFHEYNLSSIQSAFLESSHSNMSSTQPLSADSTIDSLQPLQCTGLGFDDSQPVYTNSLSTTPTGVSLGDFTQQPPQLFSSSNAIDPLELFFEHEQMWQTQGHLMATAEQNWQPSPDIQLDPRALSNFVGGHFNDHSTRVSSSFSDLHLSSDLLPESTNHGANGTSQMVAPAVQHPSVLQSHSSLPARTVSLDLPSYELLSNEDSGSGDVFCSETGIVNNLAYHAVRDSSSCSFPGATNTVPSLATVPSWALNPENEAMDILHSDQYVLGP
ncbi:hypothetical protein L207DRAFT_260563 [Hyaloscypha variabilis F]|uniref:Uncharacterized protein n=1 Tax=Hyaloscypha variabilis (strain UAMH 11265 / GT02V1 / F) TaxID=1149755 RepID=A0A2J6S503_HYAVF|nr:hypothetical protein L207DRAFT_260563 [Hyaloscypha variabilis F]